jgi:hypothetical protein
MEKIDLRKLEPAALYEKKQQVIRLKQKRYKGKEIEELRLVIENQVSKIWRAFCKGGAKAIKPRTGHKRTYYAALWAGYQSALYNKLP